MQDIDIIIPYRNSGTDELKYCLRSIAAHVQHRKIYICGDCPAWTQNVTKVLIPTRQRGAQLDCEVNIRAALGLSDVSDNFILFNDDFFVLNSIERLPNWHEGTIAQVASVKEVSPVTRPAASNLLRTAKLLNSTTVSSRNAFTLHVPVIMNKIDYMTCSQIAMSYLVSGKTVLPRTVYGNMFAGDSEAHSDVKIYDKTAPLPNGDFASTFDRAWGGVAGDQIRSMFNNKCVYEA